MIHLQVDALVLRGLALSPERAEALRRETAVQLHRLIEDRGLPPSLARTAVFGAPGESRAPRQHATAGPPGAHGPGPTRAPRRRAAPEPHLDPSLPDRDLAAALAAAIYRSL